MTFPKARILVVDDEEATRYTVTRMLKAEGYETLEAATGLEALEAARTLAPDLVVLDIRLPDIHGFEVAERLRADEVTRSIAILQLSASFTEPGAQAQGLRRGADGYLTHPVDGPVLCATVQALLRMRRAEQREKEARERAEASERQRERLLSEAKEYAAERERLIAALHEEGNRKNEFLAVLSHELRNPLTPILASLYILRHAAPGSEQTNRARDVIDRQVHHLTRLIDDLLDLTRITCGKIRLQREPLELNGVLQRVAEDHREHFRRANIELTLDIPEVPRVVDGDATRLAQVIGNLLQNAAKFTPPGGHVSLALGLGGPKEALVKVRDTGAGMTEETLRHIFRPFMQAERTLDRSGGGLGLGLALARGIIELHGGVLVAESAGPGRGSLFSVRLPLAPAVRGVVASTSAGAHVTGTRRVLIIEDSTDAAQSLREMLEMSRHVVEVAYDGTEGLAKARAFQPEVVLCDIGLPMMDGYAVARQMRADPHLCSAYLIALSGYALQEDIGKSKEAGFDWHLAKPANMDTLSKLLAEATPSHATARLSSA